MSKKVRCNVAIKRNPSPEKKQINVLCQFAFQVTICTFLTNKKDAVNRGFFLETDFISY